MNNIIDVHSAVEKGLFWGSLRYAPIIHCEYYKGESKYA